MILFLILFQNAGGFHTEVVPPISTNNVMVQAFVKTPQMSIRDVGCSRIIADILLESSSDITRDATFSETAASGYPITIRSQADGIAISFGVPNNRAGDISTILEGLLHDVSFDRKTFLEARDRLAFRINEPWSIGLQPISIPYEHITLDDINRFYAKNVLPSHTFITLSGPPVCQSIFDNLKSDATDWHFPAPRYHYETSLPLRLAESSGSTVSLISYPCAVIDPNNQSFPADCLAAYALDSGKGSVVWQLFREKLEWSYRQEFDFLSDADGIKPTLCIACDSDKVESDAGRVKNLLLTAIQGLTKVDLDRAKAVATSQLLNGIGMSPLLFGGDVQVATTPFGGLFLTNYWRAKTGQDWDATDLAEKLRKVTLDQLISAASAMINSGGPVVVPGKG